MLAFLIMVQCHVYMCSSIYIDLQGLATLVCPSDDNEEASEEKEQEFWHVTCSYLKQSVGMYMCAM